MSDTETCFWCKGAGCVWCEAAPRPAMQREESWGVAIVYGPVPEDIVKTVFSGDRSDWKWVILPNGDSMLAVFPQAETYMEAIDAMDAAWMAASKEGDA